MVSSKASTVAEYLGQLSDEQAREIKTARNFMNKNLPKGYIETMQHGMISWVAPVQKTEVTHHGTPLAVAALAAQKNKCSLYLIGMYVSPSKSKWFLEESLKNGYKLDMGKSCIRFKSFEDLPKDLLARVVSAMDLKSFVEAHKNSY
jgi:hypothetical protein